jgi:hypothetical protein
MSSAQATRPCVVQTTMFLLTLGARSYEAPGPLSLLDTVRVTVYCIPVRSSWLTGMREGIRSRRETSRNGPSRDIPECCTLRAATFPSDVTDREWLLPAHLLPAAQPGVYLHWV